MGTIYSDALLPRVKADPNEKRFDCVSLSSNIT